MNKEEMREYQHQWYRKNRKQILKHRMRRRLKWVRRLIRYLGRHPCVDCSEDDVRVLEFDHVRGRKRYHVSHMVVTMKPWSLIKKEMAKCEVVCRNCHVKRTAERAGWSKVTGGKVGHENRIKAAKKMLKYLLRHPCKCGEDDPTVLEFDHVRGIKESAVSTLVVRGNWEAAKEEIKKCRVRCANCHRRKTSKKADWLKVRLAS